MMPVVTLNNGKADSGMSRRARLATSISAIAAASCLPLTAAQASEVDFGSYAEAIQSAQAIAAQSPATSFAQAVALNEGRTLPAGFTALAVELLHQEVAPVLSVGLVDSERSVVCGEVATFVCYSNYPGAIERSEIRLFDSNVAPDGIPHSVQPVGPTGAATWTPTNYASHNMYYVYRAYDALGRFDETAPQAIDVLVAGSAAERTTVSRPTFGMVDSAAQRGIDLSSATPVIAYGTVTDRSEILTIGGQVVPIGPDGSFTATLIQPSGCAGVQVGLSKACGQVKTQTLPRKAWATPPVTSPTSEVAGRQASGSTTGLDIRTVPAGQSIASAHSVEVRLDGNSAEAVMSVGLIGSERTIVAGTPAQFQSYTNYPSYVAKGEIRIFVGGSATDSAPLAIAETDGNGFAQWTPDQAIPRDLFYVFRVYDAKGRFDESQPQELTVVPKPVKVDGIAASRPNFGLVDEARIRNIPMNRSATVTVRGKADPALHTVRVSGQLVPVNPDGQFITQQLVDRDARSVAVAIDQAGQTTFATVREISVPRDDWFVVGQGDLTLRSARASGPAIEVSGDPLADGTSLTSRAAIYAKGRFGDDWRLTASLDTGEALLKDMFSNLDRKDPRELLRRLGSSEYYTTYGDDSTLVEDAPTQGQFYLKLQRADSSLMVGNYVVDLNQAELAPLDRGLFGLALDHKSQATTSFGERQFQVTAFASDPGTVPGRDEFRGTGGSLYFLKRQDLTVGSERLRVEVRDRDSGIVLESRELRPQEDYEIDYFQGRVTLLRPLASTVATNATVRDSSAAGNVPVLVVRYEYSPPVGQLDGYTLGGRGSAWLGDTLRLGLSAQRETTDTADQTLLAADAVLRLAAGTHLKGEIAQTDGPAFGQGNSIDGGLSFTDIAAPGLAGRKAQAWKVEGAVDFAEMLGATGDRGKFSVFLENFDAGFAAASQLTQSKTRRWGGALSLPIGTTTRVNAEYEVLDSASAGTHRTANLNLSQKFGRDVELKLGLRHDQLAAGLLYNSIQQGERTDAAAQISYAPQGKNWSLHAFGQGTLRNDASRRRNDRAGVGAKADITDRLSFAAEVSEGDGGLGADVQLNRRYGQGSEAYIGYSLITDRTDSGFESASLFTRSNSGTLTVGARHRFNSALSIYGENRIGHGGSAPSTMRSLGVKFDPSKELSFSGSFENGQIDDAATGLFRRTAATFGFGYTTEDIQLGSNVEARFERRGAQDQTVWLFRNSASVQLNPDFRALGRLNFALADKEGPSIRAADYFEGTIGLAYRPVLHDRLNLLARYSYFQDMGPIGQITAGGETNSTKQRSQIGVIDLNYDLSESLTVGAKYGYREGQVALNRTSDQFVSSNTHLGVLRLDWHPIKQWDLLVEGHYLSNDLAGNDRWGGLAAIYRHLGKNAKLGIGYSFSDFSDDLTDQSYTSSGVFFNLLGKF